LRRAEPPLLKAANDHRERCRLEAWLARERDRSDRLHDRRTDSRWTLRADIFNFILLYIFNLISSPANVTCIDNSDAFPSFAGENNDPLVLVSAVRDSAFSGCPFQSR